MATNAMKKGMPFEKSSKDNDSKAVLKKYGKEGSPKEEAYDKTQMKNGSGAKKPPPSFVAAKSFKKK